jgi:hypothetical protein
MVRPDVPHVLQLSLAFRVNLFSVAENVRLLNFRVPTLPKTFRYSSTSKAWELTDSAARLERFGTKSLLDGLVSC